MIRIFQRVLQQAAPVTMAVSVIIIKIADKFVAFSMLWKAYVHYVIW